MAKQDLNSGSDPLLMAIVRVLTSRPGLEARRIGSLLRSQGWSGLRRKEVNSALYRGLASGEFRKDGSATPKWWLSGGSGGIEPSARRSSDGGDHRTPRGVRPPRKPQAAEDGSDQAGELEHWHVIELD